MLSKIGEFFSRLGGRAVGQFVETLVVGLLAGTSGVTSILYLSAPKGLNWSIIEQPEPPSAMAMNAAPASERRASRSQPFDKKAPDSTSAMLQGLGLRAGEAPVPPFGDEVAH